MKIAVLFGGRSPESDISVITAMQALAALSESEHEVRPFYMCDGVFYTGKLDSVAAFTPFRAEEHTAVALYGGVFCSLRRGKLKREWKPDVALICCHGGEGENGVLQGLLDFNGVPYCSSGVAGSAIGMDKVLSKRIFDNMLLNVVPYAVLSRTEYADGKCEGALRAAKLDYPLIVKPVSQGSSIGISAAENPEELARALETAFEFGDKAIVEEKLVDFTEVNCAAFMREGKVVVSETEQPVSAGDILTFEDKYMRGEKGGGNIMPADIGDLNRVVRANTEKIYRELELFGVVRVDFLVDKARGKVYVNEINTVPGSLAFYLFEPLGIDFTQLLEALAAEGAARGRRIADKTVFRSPVLEFYGKRGAKSRPVRK